MKVSRVSLIFTTAMLCFWQPCGSALAADQESRISELERKLEQSLRLIDELSAKIRRLESGAGASPTTAGPKPGDSAASPEPRMEPMGGGLAGARSADQGTPLHGFADVGGGLRRGGPKGFSTGSLDFYLTPQFGDRVRALFEPLIEFNANGEVGLDLERAQIGYAFSDALVLWGGRFRTPYGYYNTAFHHGQLMQTSIKKPKFLDFEDKGGILPAHTVGVWGTGKARLGDGHLTYDAFVGNSPSITGGTLDMNNSGSRNHNASTGLNVGYKFAGNLDGLKVGGHFLRARVVDDSDPPNVTTMNTAGPYAAYDNGIWEAYFEYYRFDDSNKEDNTGVGTGRQRSSAWFAQLGRHFGSWTPYTRMEKASLNQADNYFALQTNGRSYTRYLGGLRYDLNPKAALTLELNHTRQSDAPLLNYNELRAQYAIGF